ncbi:hypothetical protein TNCV_3913181 [Trichonephila clavipes]|nr:hypothetical protein TNCV_3913181 [Trichonephila clavipes]
MTESVANSLRVALYKVIRYQTETLAGFVGGTETTRKQIQGCKCRSCREKEQKQQHMNGTENILLKGYITTSARNYDQKSSGRRDNELYGIPYVLKVTYPLGNYRDSS